MTWQALLDKLEPGMTRQNSWGRGQPHRAWVVAAFPDCDLPPAEDYTWPLFWRVATPPGMGVVVLLLVTTVLVAASLWHQFSAFFTDPKYHRAVIRLASRMNLYALPWALLGLLLFNYALYLPRRFFWNRRAARLRRQTGETAVQTLADLAPDPAVWPPPPRTWE